MTHSYVEVNRALSLTLSLSDYPFTRVIFQLITSLCGSVIKTRSTTKRWWRRGGVHHIENAHKHIQIENCGNVGKKRVNKEPFNYFPSGELLKSTRKIPTNVYVPDSLINVTIWSMFTFMISALTGFLTDKYSWHERYIFTVKFLSKKKRGKH